MLQFFHCLRSSQAHTFDRILTINHAESDSSIVLMAANNALLMLQMVHPSIVCDHIIICNRIMACDIAIFSLSEIIASHVIACNVSEMHLSCAIVSLPAIVESGYIAYNSHRPSLTILLILLPFCSNLIFS